MLERSPIADRDKTILGLPFMPVPARTKIIITLSPNETVCAPYVLDLHPSCAALTLERFDVDGSPLPTPQPVDDWEWDCAPEGKIEIVFFNDTDAPITLCGCVHTQFLEPDEDDDYAPRNPDRSTELKSRLMH